MSSDNVQYTFFSWTYAKSFLYVARMKIDFYWVINNIFARSWEIFSLRSEYKSARRFLLERWTMNSESQVVINKSSRLFVYEFFEFI
jgi:hypothetical protein